MKKGIILTYPLEGGIVARGRLSYQLFGQRGHGTILRADVGAHLYGQLVGLSHGLTAEDGCAERTRERVARTDGVGYLYVRRL